MRRQLSQAQSRTKSFVPLLQQQLQDHHFLFEIPYRKVLDQNIQNPFKFHKQESEPQINQKRQLFSQQQTTKKRVEQLGESKSNPAIRTYCPQLVSFPGQNFELVRSSNVLKRKLHNFMDTKYKQNKEQLPEPEVNIQKNQSDSSLCFTPKNKNHEISVIEIKNFEEQVSDSLDEINGIIFDCNMLKGFLIQPYNKQKFKIMMKDDISSKHQHNSQSSTYQPQSINQTTSSQQKSYQIKNLNPQMFLSNNTLATNNKKKNEQIMQIYQGKGGPTMNQIHNPYLAKTPMIYNYNTGKQYEFKIRNGQLLKGWTSANNNQEQPKLKFTKTQNGFRPKKDQIK